MLRNATGCPTFLIGSAGPWIVILGAVITDGVIGQRLTNCVWVGLDSVLNEPHITHVARTFHALKASLEKLNIYYESLHLIDNYYFPYCKYIVVSMYSTRLWVFRPHLWG
jgi:hypothetical protein